MELLEKEKAIDFNQMQIRALKLMNEGHIPEYSNILIDEFQDTDPIQMEIFKKLISPKTNPKINSVTVVGDVDQSIYGFRGGSNKDYFKELRKLEDVKFEEVVLSTNYRSTEEIIDFTQDFISHQHVTPKELDPKELECGSEKHNDVYFLVNEDKKTEAQNIFEVIKYIMADERMKLSDIGLLMRSVTQKSTCLYPLIDLFKENDINYQLIGTGDLQDVDELKYLLTLMYHLIQDDDPFSTFVPKPTATWLNIKTLTGANDNKVLFELSEETKKELNKQQEKFEKKVIDKDVELCKDPSHKEWRCNGITKFHRIFESKPRKRQEEVFSLVEKPILSDENLVKWGITNERDLEFFHKLNDLKRRVNAENYRDRPTLAQVYFELLCDPIF